MLILLISCSYFIQTLSLRFPSELVAAQVNELNAIRQALYDLEAQHTKIRQQYEDEMMRLRAEVHSVRTAVGSTTPSLKPATVDGYYRDKERERDNGRSLDRDRDLMRDRDIDRERERDRLLDTRDPKRPKYSPLLPPPLPGHPSASGTHSQSIPTLPPLSTKGFGNGPSSSRSVA